MMEKRLNGVVERMKSTLPRLIWRKIWKVGKEDRRRVIHSLKMGLSLTLVSLLYLLEPLFKGIGENAIWAVMTVVVVLEFTAGATLYKGLNRGLGTVFAGSLAFLIECIATESGHIFHAVFIGTSVFLVGAVATYMRFYPHIKKNYDYGVVIFLLTFNLITVSSYRVDSVLKIAHERFYTIAIGCAICLLMSLLVFPIWSGEDLHISTVAKFDGLAKSIEACINEYFSDKEEQEKAKENSMEAEDPIYNGYKAVLDSKSSDETLAVYASWEPRYLRRCSRLPWQQYVKLGTLIRHFGYTLVALHGCLQTEIKTPRSVRVLFKDPCNQLAKEVTKVLKELGDSIRNRRQCCPEMLSNHLNEALQGLINALKSQPRLFLGTNSNINILALTGAISSRQKSSKDFVVSLSSVNNIDTSNEGPARLGLGRDFLAGEAHGTTPALSKDTSKKDSEPQMKLEAGGRKSLRPTLSKIGITSLEFLEALPFAAFASLLVETVARLDLVIEEVVELGRIAHFKEYNPDDDHVAVITCDQNPRVEDEIVISRLQTQFPSSHAAD
ncbi:aluminum-activated malate transporter 12-like isoform X1 [Nicotiana sylvestris]|uniref:Aluminum-activated malate transporter 12-like n=2 Tax=Nicotiana TaxID=4085 RepID=A0A1S4AQ49_TOBAC|nr:PREDICTED: aluminum-activated malate transporter 12-like isoform X1 [Nicotiana sylvestris]XP_016478809.1 PREDICTED: aluminum-activated malate transporter 12-like [Nicotiana tabacum]